MSFETRIVIVLSVGVVVSLLLLSLKFFQLPRHTQWYAEIGGRSGRIVGCFPGDLRVTINTAPTAEEKDARYKKYLADPSWQGSEQQAREQADRHPSWVSGWRWQAKIREVPHF